MWLAGYGSQTPKLCGVLVESGDRRSFGAARDGGELALVGHGVRPALLVGASVGAINAAYYAGEPTTAGLDKLGAVWRSLRRRAVFPVTPYQGLMGLLARRDYLISSEPLRSLLRENLFYTRVEDARVACRLIATDLVDGGEVEISEGDLVQALLASCAIPGIFPPVRIGGRTLVDGGVASNAPVAAALAAGADRVIVLPTGASCAVTQPPRGALNTAVQALNLMIIRQLGREVDRFAAEARVRVVPPLCPLDVSAYDFSRSGDLIDRAQRSTEAWLDDGGLERSGIPASLALHSHRA
ncbi:MAG: patatin-like phospholipase family protein [Candidatus Binatia bacterium]